ncbi:MAG TPA: carboxyl transferase domain-containing protein, partial [Acidimicrobiales bacterium]|nr:carboxyl transferase domain-containing protein [Acidimicrobiales bacterium]
MAHDPIAAKADALQSNLATGGAEKLERDKKMFVRDRVALLLDEGTFVEDALLANASAGNLAADGVVTGVGRVDGRPVVVIANDPLVKAGSWGARTVEKIIRATE